MEINSKHRAISHTDPGAKIIPRADTSLGIINYYWSAVIVVFDYSSGIVSVRETTCPGGSSSAATILNFFFFSRSES